MMSPSNQPEAILALSDRSPFIRMSGASWFLDNAETGDSQILVSHLQRESVPAVKGLLVRALRIRQATRDIGEDKHQGSLQSRNPKSGEIVQDVPNMVRHELGPSIGWIKSAIREEIPDYQNSRAWRAAERLQRRLDGLTALLKVDGDIELEPINLELMVDESWPGAINRLRFVRPSKPLMVLADRHLLLTIIANAFQNVIDAQPGADARADVVLGAESGTFWLRISNPFEGVSFEVRPESDGQVSSRGVQRGRGSRFMMLAARRLGYDLRIRGDSGVAVLALSGDI